MLQPDPSLPPHHDRAPGVVLAACAVVMIVAISHHPTVGRAPRGDVLAKIVQLTALDQAVHAVVIAVAGGLLFAMVHYALRRGVRSNLVLGALVAYCIGTLTLIGAALIDGFLVPGLAARAVHAVPGVVDATFVVLGACALAIQVCTKLGLVATSVAVLLWSVDLLSAPPRAPAVAVIGVVTALVAPAIAFATAYVNPQILGAIVILQAAWYVSVAALLLRGRV